MTEQGVIWKQNYVNMDFLMILKWYFLYYFRHKRHFLTFFFSDNHKYFQFGAGKNITTNNFPFTNIILMMFFTAMQLCKDVQFASMVGGFWRNISWCNVDKHDVLRNKNSISKATNTVECFPLLRYHFQIEIW